MPYIPNSDTTQLTCSVTEGAIAADQQQVEPRPILVGSTTADEFNTIGERLIPKACFRFEDVTFEYDSSFVLPRVKTDMESLANLRDKHTLTLPGSQEKKIPPPLSIFGHADPVGYDDYNKKLSGRRAQAIYGMLVRDENLWDDLFLHSLRYGHDNWGDAAIETMLNIVSPPPKSQDEATETQTQDRVKVFQTENKLVVDGIVGTETRKALYRAYMDVLCGKHLELDKKEDFLGHNKDAGGKGDYQGCSEFNPVIMFSQEEDAEYEKAKDKTERNQENQPNRRVMVLLFAPGRRVDPQLWPCPQVKEGVSACNKRFFLDAPKRRSFQEKRREFADTKDTFACRFYQLISDDSPCETKRPSVVPPKEKLKCKRIAKAPLKFLQHNTALLPIFYKGAVSRDVVVSRLICLLREENPDIVGLSECFKNDERARIKTELRDIYPEFHEGPNHPGIEQNGGLLILSKHPIIERHSTIYRQCKGEDCITSKGVLHACILVQGHPAPYDVFLTHMQSCPPMTEQIKGGLYNLGIPVISLIFGLGRDCLEKLHFFQVLHLRSFVHAYSSPFRPALLMGDLNHNGRDEAIRRTLVARLGHPEDLWLSSPGTGDKNGITQDDFRSFNNDKPPRAADDPKRGKDGERLDYFFSWRKFEIMRPKYTKPRVVVWQSAPGRDISDHYGLITQQTEICEVDIDVTQKIKTVTVSLKAFHCLTETGGSIPLISTSIEQDEVEFELSVRAATGQSQKLKTELIEDVDAGTYHVFNPPYTMTFNDPGDGLNVYVTGWEVDTAPFSIETGRVTLGPVEIFVYRQELMLHKGKSMWRTPPLLKGDEGEYAVILEITTTV